VYSPIRRAQIGKNYIDPALLRECILRNLDMQPLQGTVDLMEFDGIRSQARKKNF